MTKVKTGMKKIGKFALLPQAVNFSPFLVTAPVCDNCVTTMSHCVTTVTKLCHTVSQLCHNYVTLFHNHVTLFHNRVTTVTQLTV